jgi:ABC-type dipeptide/oligopeptide/nickel transport system permease component
VRALILRIARVPLTLLALWALFTTILPAALVQYPAFSLARGAASGCIRRPGTIPFGTDACAKTISDVYGVPVTQVVLDATLRSVALLAVVALFAFSVGLVLGVSAALLRHRAVGSGVILGSTSVIAAIPSFFLAYFLQILIIILGGIAGHTILPVFGYGLDGHLVLPLLTLGLPAIAIAAQITAARTADVLDADFVTVARAKGLLTSWIVRVHVLPHVVPVVLEAVGSGVRVAVASLPIIEFILGWNGVGFLALEAIAVRDPVALSASLLLLAAFFSLTSLLLDLRRERFH